MREMNPASLVAAVEAVEALHQPRESPPISFREIIQGKQVCDSCLQPYPCETTKALTATLGETRMRNERVELADLMIPGEAFEAAKEAMREVTPPPGITKADWLAEHGDFALIAGAIAAAAPLIKAAALDKAADDAEGLGLPEVPVHSLRYGAFYYKDQAGCLPVAEDEDDWNARGQR